MRFFFPTYNMINLIIIINTFLFDQMTNDSNLYSN